MIDRHEKPLPTHIETAVIGGGTAGCSTALHLALMGRPVILFEQRLCGSQASGANYGGVRQQGRCEEEMSLSFRARGLWEKMAKIVGHDCGFRPSGHLKLARTEAQFADLESWAAMAKRHGLEIVLYDKKTLHDLHPYLSDEALGGSFCASDGSANPRITAPLFARAAETAGADLREQCPVKGLSREGAGFRIELADGRSLATDVIVNTAGAWGAGLAAQLGDDYPEGLLAPNMNVTEPLPPVLTVNFGVCGGDIYFRQTGRGNVIFGGGRGTGDRDRICARPLAEVNAGQASRVIRMLPCLRSALVIRSWSGLDGEMPDVRPVFGESPKVPGLFHAFGFSGHGFQLGPGAGAVLCDLVTKGKTETDISGLSPRRFL